MDKVLKDNIYEMMSIIDKNSDKIQSFDYMQLCKNMKNIHNFIEKKSEQKIVTNEEYICRKST